MGDRDSDGELAALVVRAALAFWAGVVVGRVVRRELDRRKAARASLRFSDSRATIPAVQVEAHDVPDGETAPDETRK